MGRTATVGQVISGDGSAGIADKDDMLGLQGGRPGEYYHFQREAHDDLADWWDGGQATGSGHGLADGYAERVHVSDGQYHAYLRAGRVPYTTTGGLLTDDAALTFCEATGQVTAAQYSTLNDSDTYLGFPAANKMALTLGGTETVRVISGAVGINLGGADPAAPLEVASVSNLGVRSTLNSSLAANQSQFGAVHHTSAALAVGLGSGFAWGLQWPGQTVPVTPPWWAWAQYATVTEVTSDPSAAEDEDELGVRSDGVADRGRRGVDVPGRVGESYPSRGRWRCPSPG